MLKSLNGFKSTNYILMTHRRNFWQDTLFWNTSIHWSVHPTRFKVWIKAGCACAITVTKPGLVWWASNSPLQLPPCPSEATGQSCVSAKEQHWVAAEFCLLFPLQRTQIWASTQIPTDLELHAMFETLSDLTENGAADFKQITGKLTEEQFCKPNFLRKCKEKNPPENQSKPKHTLWKV